MFDWLKGLSDVLDPSPAVAGNAAAIGAVALLFIANGWWPLNSGEVITAPAAAFLVLWGVVALASRGIRWLNVKRVASALQKKERIAIEEHNANLPAEIDLNLGTLSQFELAQLIWILRNGRQRVDERVAYSLIEKHILVPIKPRNHRLVEVHQYVWSKRDELLEANKNVRPGGAFPSGRILV